MLRIYEGFLEARNRQVGKERHDVSVKDLDNDSELLASLNEFYAKYHKIAPETLKRISMYIRNNTGEFVQIEIDD
jgi:predicted transcriptional regulator YheO